MRSRINAGSLQSAPAKNTQLVLENDRGKSTRTGNALKFHSVAKMMRKKGGTAAFAIDACSAILYKEIRSRNIIRDDATNAHGIPALRLRRGELSHLFHAGEQGKWRRLREHRERSHALQTYQQQATQDDRRQSLLVQRRHAQI